jgi:uncharacterized Ntn-hydrolase superfamily protein
MSKKSLAACLIFAVVIMIAVGYYLSVAAPQLTQSQPYQGYTKLTVVEGQGKVATFGGYEYAFTYDHNNQLFAVATDITILPSTYKTTVGATYTIFGLEIKVAEAHVGYCVLMVKSTVP